ncbi:ferredoxin--NADP reductase [Mangrovitalea sediminis]|uniref:ferredoxin--NADP reductase n=1 Tax=Mangrovitalea sediminis TaxID=1982043 RepID=UPI000BE4B3E5|nr:ferredoxin--NADP reductase [Mangrovitalea sediminis]
MPNTILGSLLGWVYRDEVSRIHMRRDQERLQRAANRRAWGQISRHHSSVARPVRVERIERETPDTLSLYLRAEDAAPVNYRAGQFLTCCFVVDGEERRRAYSLSAPAEHGLLRITVKRLPEGRVSAFIHESLKVGDRFRILGPSGDFVLTPDIHQAVFIAAGAGITPIRGLLEALLQREGDARVTLIYASRDEDSIIFRDELDALSRSHPALTLHYVLSQPGKGWEGLRGRLEETRLSALLNGLDDGGRTHFFLCGPEGFLAMAEQSLRALSVAPDHWHEEHFRAAAESTAARPTEAQTVHFEKSGRTVEVAPGQSLLEAGLSAGLPLSFSCQVGGCGHCRVRIIDGDVVSDQPNSLSPEEYRQGYRLACLSYPCNETRVDA